MTPTVPLMAEYIVYVLQNMSLYIKNKNHASSLLTPLFKERNINIDETFCKNLVTLNNLYKKIFQIYNGNTTQFLESTK